MKKLISFVLSLSLLIFPVSCNIRGLGGAPVITAEELKIHFGKGFGDPSGLRFYDRGDVLVINLPKSVGQDAASGIRNICYDHALVNPKNRTRLNTAMGIALIINTVLFAVSLASIFTPKLFESLIPECDLNNYLSSSGSYSSMPGYCLSIDIAAICVFGVIEISLLACWVYAYCMYFGIKSKDESVNEICNKLNQKVRDKEFIGKNILVIAFDKQDCGCRRKAVDVEFRYVEGLDESLAPVVRDSNYFGDFVFTTDRKGPKALESGPNEYDDGVLLDDVK